MPVPGAKRPNRTASTSSSCGQGRLQRPDEEVGGGDLAATRRADGLDDAAGQHQHRGHLARRVGVRDRPDRRAAVADRRVRHVAQGLAQQRQRGARPVVALQPGVADQGADPHPASVTSTASSPDDAVDVDEVAGAARRMLSSGMRLCPPASTLPSWPTSASTPTASSTVRGAWCTNGAGFTERSCLVDGAGERHRPAREVAAPGRGGGRCGSGASVALGVAVARGAGVALLVEVVDTVAVTVGVVTDRDRGSSGTVGPLAQLLGGDRPGQVVADDGDDGAERDAARARSRR